jgi:hypothetical protein
MRAWASTGALSSASILRLMSMIVSLSLTSWSVNVRLVNVCTLSRIPPARLYFSEKGKFHHIMAFDDGRDACFSYQF